MERSFLVKTETGFSRPPQPVPGAWRSLRTGAVALGEAIKLLKPRGYAPMSRMAFVARYAGLKRARYLRAALSLKSRVLTAADSMIRGFIKVETTDGTMKIPVPRLISTRMPRFGLELGRYLAVIEKHVFGGIAVIAKERGWTKTDLPQVLKGYNPRERGNIARQKWQQFASPCAIGLDGNRFDQHVSRDAMAEFEHVVYNTVFGSPYLAWMLRQQLFNRGSARMRDGTRVAWGVQGVRQSGDMNTSLGNSLIMCYLTLHICAGLGVTVELLNDGDDTVIICERRDAVLLRDKLQEEYLKYGFSIREESFTVVFERIVFCQFQPVLHHDGWRFVRRPEVHIAKAGSGCGKWASPQSWGTQMWAMGLSSVHMYHGTPMMDHYSRLMYRSGTAPRRRSVMRHLDETGFSMHARALAGGADALTRLPTEVVISPATRASFYLAFGISPAVQRAFERQTAAFIGPTIHSQRHGWEDVRAAKWTPTTLHLLCQDCIAQSTWSK